MKHLTDQEITAAPFHDHLVSCALCSARKQELEGALQSFAAAQKRRQLPSIDDPRARLLARLADASHSAVSQPRSGWFAIAACALAVVCLAVYAARPIRFISREGAAIPNPRLTPGATVLMSRDDVCRDSRDSNRTVPVSLRKKVFESYGIPNAEPRAYEVDYLITPALGGADDINNLWPEPYGSTVWNARVKDALENHLRDLVCEGKVDLPTAQHDISTNWIAAYKKYFKTSRPRNFDN